MLGSPSVRPTNLRGSCTGSKGWINKVDIKADIGFRFTYDFTGLLHDITISPLLRFIDPEIAQDVMTASTSRFEGAEIHVFNQADTSLVSYIAALDVDGEIVLLSWRSTAFFEIPELVERGKLKLNYAWTMLDDQVSDSGWLAGDNFSLADIDLLICADFSNWVKSPPPESCTRLLAALDRIRQELG